MKIGIVGIGRAGTRRLRGITKLFPKVEVSFLCDINEAALERAKKLVAAEIPDIASSIRTYRHYTSALAHSECQVVVISTPHWNHQEIAEAALKANKHILVEKPPACTTESVQTLLDLARRSGRIIKVGSNFRFTPLAIALTKYVWPEIGPVSELRVWMTIDLHTLPVWAYHYDQSCGGALLDNAVHLIDFVLWSGIAQGPLTVRCNLQSRKLVPENEVNLQLMWDQGKALIQVARTKMTTVPYIQGQAKGNRGKCQFSFGPGCMVRMKKRNQKEWTMVDIVPNVYSWDADTHAFVNKLQRAEQPEPSLQHWLKVAQIVDAGYTSNTMGQAVRLGEE